MPLSLVTFEDKVTVSSPDLPANQIGRAVDFNELKAVLNAVVAVLNAGGTVSPGGTWHREVVADSRGFGQYSTPFSATNPINSWARQSERLFNNSSVEYGMDTWPGQDAAWYIANKLPALLARIAAYPDPSRYIVHEDFGANPYGKTPAQVYADRKQIWDAVRNAGGKVIAGTTLHRTDVSGFSPYRAELNTLVRAAPAGSVNAVADFAAHATMGTDAAAANSDLYPDGIHESSYGHSLVAPSAAAALATVTGLTAGAAPATTILRQPVPTGFTGATLQLLNDYITQAGSLIAHGTGGSGDWAHGGFGTLGSGTATGSTPVFSFFFNVNRSLGGGVLVGAADTAAVTGLGDADYGLALTPGGLYVYENGASVYGVGGGANNVDVVPALVDVYTDKVVYTINNAVAHTTTAAVAFPLGLLVRLYGPGAQLLDLSILARAPLAFPFATAPAGPQFVNWAQGSANSAYDATTHTVSRLSGGGSWDAGRLGTLGIGDITASSGWLGTYAVPDMVKATGGVVTGVSAMPTLLSDVGYPGITAASYWDDGGTVDFFRSGTGLNIGGNTGGAPTAGASSIQLFKDGDVVRFDFYIGTTLRGSSTLAYSPDLFPFVPDCSLNAAGAQLVGATIEAANLVATGF
jgi:hypothetical protein